MTHSAMTRHPRNPRDDTALKTVPKVRLYVERDAEQENWFVNVGHMTDRGRWRTAPHAHPKYGQVIFVRKGRGVMNLEGRSLPFEGPCALLLPTECVHGLDYEMDVDRWVVTIEVAYLTQVNAKLHEFIQLWSLPRMIPLSYAPEAEDDFYRLVRSLEHEIQSNAVGHIVGTEALLTTLLLMLVRGADLEQPVSEGAVRNDIRLTERFRELIEQHYRENLQLQDYASMMAVSLVQLRTACASAAGQSPAKMIHARLITEARRHLIFGDMSVEQIAFWLGFADAAYFTRFFRKEVGQTPSQFRITARQQPQRAPGGA
ncbi:MULTISPECIES: helix-turn-helix domain-containing protein [unclassified Herbaspirillum]|uniref:helix-turn-helix domain-containing protein n=1 Tax=unclassified Herbaspirillum TaxID=2624150 RepID=UPI00114DA01B|nr:MULTISPECIES: helix-turn-helix domain-containing protein [unclassified Herbaspirillum]MBB5390442.1 AraC family transcriptional activator of pobA [Herbaspirillum sp. SJZ102]TQK09063.1 AraC family transcriptional activator of pobA [Herbaspirillum sp. SJZ130]TQK14250.1 AraC family transcriptional activator of pobA [Herbaspirillum sp. SJZ106]